MVTFHQSSFGEDLLTKRLPSQLSDPEYSPDTPLDNVDAAIGGTDSRQSNRHTPTALSLNNTKIWGYCPSGWINSAIITPTDVPASYVHAKRNPLWMEVVTGELDSLLMNKT